MCVEWLSIWNICFIKHLSWLTTPWTNDNFFMKVLKRVHSSWMHTVCLNGRSPNILYCHRQSSLTWQWMSKSKPWWSSRQSSNFFFSLLSWNCLALPPSKSFSEKRQLLWNPNWTPVGLRILRWPFKPLKTILVGNPFKAGRTLTRLTCLHIANRSTWL